jgi:TctA family transporter
MELILMVDMLNVGFEVLTAVSTKMAVFWVKRVNYLQHSYLCTVVCAYNVLVVRTNNNLYH